MFQFPHSQMFYKQFKPNNVCSMHIHELEWNYLLITYSVLHIYFIVNFCYTHISSKNPAQLLVVCVHQTIQYTLYIFIIHVHMTDIITHLM